MAHPQRGENRTAIGFVALAAGAVSLALLVPLVLSIVLQIDFTSHSGAQDDTAQNSLHALLSLVFAGLAIGGSRHVLEYTDEGTLGHRVAVAAVLVASTSLAILGLLAIFIILYFLSYGGG